jgi:peptide deformylase
MILPIYVYGHPKLRKVSADINKEHEGLEKLLKDMWQTMYETDGVGLAAPQIGKNIRVFVIDANPFADIDSNAADFKRTFINAEITERSGEPWIMNEGCLSIPNIHEDITRDEKIHIKYYDENWELHEEDFDGHLARVIQHEYDHLEGKMFIDYVSPLMKRLLKGKLSQISKGKARCSYRTVTP